MMPEREALKCPICGYEFPVSDIVWVIKHIDADVRIECQGCGNVDYQQSFWLITDDGIDK